MKISGSPGPVKFFRAKKIRTFSFYAGKAGPENKKIVLADLPYYTASAPARTLLHDCIQKENGRKKGSCRAGSTF
jgi:hypothetical protein